MRRPEWLTRLQATVSLRDGHIYGGLVLVGVGAWLVAPAAAYISVGVVLMVLGIFRPGVR